MAAGSGNTVTTSNTYSGTIEYDYVSTGDWMATKTGASPSTPTLALNQSYSVSGSDGAVELYTGRIYSASVTLATAVGNALISRANTDGYVGQVYINNQPFSGTQQPVAFSFYALLTGHYVTPLLFTVNAGIYTLAAVYQQILVNQPGLNSAPLTLLQGGFDSTATYVFGYSDRQVALSSDNTLLTTSRNSGTIEYDSVSTGDWLATETGKSPSSPALALNATFSVSGNNGAVALYTGRIYSASLTLAVPANNYGDVVLTATGNLDASSGQLTGTVNIIGNNITLTSSAGEVGNSTNPLVLQANSVAAANGGVQGGVVTVSAAAGYRPDAGHR